MTWQEHLAARGAPAPDEKYARHSGHADLIRERVDGRVGQ